MTSRACNSVHVHCLHFFYTVSRAHAKTYLRTWQGDTFAMIMERGCAIVSATCFIFIFEAFTCDTVGRLSNQVVWIAGGWNFLIHSLEARCNEEAALTVGKFREIISLTCQGNRVFESFFFLQEYYYKGQIKCFSILYGWEIILELIDWVSNGRINYLSSFQQFGNSVIQMCLVASI